MNRLFYGDNLEILRKHVADNSVDLIYLDPPFNSKADYNLLYREPTGHASDAQITAFEDTWHWTEETQRTFQEIVDRAPAQVVEMMNAFRTFVGLNDMMAYLTMMCIRLIELRRVLKDTGSIYLHCDPTASHYLKILMDTIFGKKNFRNEISWRRSQPKSHTVTNFPNCRDVILRYAITDNAKFFKVYGEYDPEYLAKFYRFTDENGRRYRLGDLTNPNKNRPNLTYEFLGVTRVWRWTKERMEKAYADGLIHQTKPGNVPSLIRYLDEMPGQPLTDDWDDIEHLHGSHGEHLGYPTQKPEALLERIIRTSTVEGDTVLDPFCGCGTAITVAQRLKRRWLGIDVTHLAVNLIKLRLKDMFSLEPRKDYQVIGEPEDVAGARELASQNRYQFQWWALSLINARPYGDKIKGSDTGIDGYIYFSDQKDKYKKAVVSVKSGNVSVKDIRDLGHVIEREKSEIGVLITLEGATRHMIKEALQKGCYRSETVGKDYPRLQILTIDDLFAAKKPRIPGVTSLVKKAPSIYTTPTEDMDL
jgi:site-specific DNA-methyltransferase (adenine-specific)